MLWYLYRALDTLIEAGAARITSWRQARCGRSRHGHAYVYAPPSTASRAGTTAARTKSGHTLDYLGDEYACRHCGKTLYLLHGAGGDEAREELLVSTVAWEVVY